MAKIKVLEVNNIDLLGNRFNGYDMISELSSDELEIKQVVIKKLSDNNNVIQIINTPILKDTFYKFQVKEKLLSIKNVFSISSSQLKDLNEYKEADIIHFHMFHNTELSLFSLIDISKEKKVVLSLHDPWFMTGRCVHFGDCDKWKTGCHDCQNLNTFFPFDEDNCNDMWNLKKYVFENIDVDLVSASDWMIDLIKTSPITNVQKNIHKIPFGIDNKKFSSISNKEARKHYEIENDEIVLFLRARSEFKGTSYVLEALRMLESDLKITVMTCDCKNLLDDVKNKYRIIDLGDIKDNEMIYAMNACDVFLMPSIGESFGMMAVEAMACEKPVIVFNNTALPSVTNAPECGYLVNNKDSEDLMRAIKYLIEDEKERIRRGKLGKKLVEKEYSNEVYNERLKKLYQDVYKRKRINKDKLKNEKIIDEYNLNQFKLYLNELTILIFGTSSDASKKLKYEVNGKYNHKYKIKFSDIKVQEVLMDYEKELYEILKNMNDSDRSIKTKLETLIHIIIKNPSYLITRIKNR